MKVGEFYRNRFNHYVSQVTEVTDKYVVLTNVQGVSDKVKVEHFPTNWSRVSKIHQFEHTIKSKFPKDFTYTIEDDFIVAESDAYEVPVSIRFSEDGTLIWLTVSDFVMGILEVDGNTVAYHLEDALDVINMIADQL